jgi:hypothetical protein
MVPIGSDRDITTVWARGDLTGSITAGRNVGAASDSDPPTESAYPIFSYGQISADISALNPAGVIGGGHIGPIGARGGIAGRFDAADSHRARRCTSHESSSRRRQGRRGNRPCRRHRPGNRKCDRRSDTRSLR